MEITGVIKVKNEAVKVSEKFTKREFVITDNSTQYPQHIVMQLTQDRCALIDKYNVGDEIKVHFNLRGREWTNPQGEVKYFNSIEAWKIEGVKWGEVIDSKPESGQVPAKPSNGDDLPF